MHTFLLVVQALLALAIVGLVLIQRSDGDGFGMGGGGGNFLSGRAKANLLTRATAIVAGLFFINSLVLTMVVNRGDNDTIASQLRAAPAGVEAPVAVPAGDAAPAKADAVPAAQAAPIAAETPKETPKAAEKPAEETPASVPLAE
jgi:preprotein translocase subunit SecG